MEGLTNRWDKLIMHPIQMEYVNSPHRFNYVPAGRRSGKTERSKRKLVARAIRGTKYRNPRLFAAAPTRDQAKRIFWSDLKALVPKAFYQGKPSESELTIKLKNGSELFVVGMDKPERVEGSPIDGGVMDEVANMKREAWTHHVRPALSDRNGWCDLIGVPEGRNHFYSWYMDALEEQREKGFKSSRGAFTWKSADILPAEEIEAARRELDELTFQQEYEASFINFTGRAYYNFSINQHVAPLQYDQQRPISFCFDFNREPGVAVVCQEQMLSSNHYGIGAIGEVYIPKNSNTGHVCNKLIQDWGEHKGVVNLYGDATGGAGGSAKIMGSDWDIIENLLFPIFGYKLFNEVPASNPRERVRVNAVNSALLSASGEVTFMIDPKCKALIKDLEGVRVLEGGSGEIDKRHDPTLTHSSDSVGYMIEKTRRVRSEIVQIGGR